MLCNSANARSNNAQAAQKLNFKFMYSSRGASIHTKAGCDMYIVDSNRSDESSLVTLQAYVSQPLAIVARNGCSIYFHRMPKACVELKGPWQFHLLDYESLIGALKNRSDHILPSCCRQVTDLRGARIVIESQGPSCYLLKLQSSIPASSLYF